MEGFTIPQEYEQIIYKRTCIFGHECYMDSPPRMFFEAAGSEPVTFWLSQPLDIIKGNCDVIKIYMILPILTKQSDRKKCMQARLSEYSDLSVTELSFVELLEDLADLVKKVATDRRVMEVLLWIGARTNNVWSMEPFPLNEALNWVLDAGDNVLHGKLKAQERHCSEALRLFFLDYSFYITKMAKEGRTMVFIFTDLCCKTCGKESEFMKMLGNDAFTRGQFDLAVDNYTEAIRFCPNNHLLFSNRALCFTRMGKFWKALSDGKKAVTLKHNWPKGHYRFCEALFLIGERDRALAYNEKAQELCKDSPEGIRDLIQQHEKFNKKPEEKRDMKSKRRSGRKHSQEKKLAAQFTSTIDTNESKKAPPAVKEDVPIKDCANGIGTENKAYPDITGPNPKSGKSKSKGGDCDEVKEAHWNADSNGTQKSDSCRPTQMDLPALQELVKTQVREGCTALEKQRCHSALGIFSRLLDILGHTDFKKLHLNNIDCAVLQYGHASALLGIGQCEELTKAEDQFKQIQHQYSKERFNCLAVYGIGNVYFRQNRFSEALKQYVKSQTMVKHKIVPGVLNWPLTDVVIEESVPEKLKLILESRIEECKFRPTPDAVCRYERCYGQPKTQIYFTDPDFKGFIRMLCNQFCKVEFHICCWKKLKSSIYADKVDKDFLKSACLTPDCPGRICHIVIYDSTGIVKCEFEDKTVRKKEPQRPPCKQKGNSNKKFKTKPENKAEHKKISHKDTIKVEVDKTEKEVTCRNGDKENHQLVVPYDIMLAHIAQKEDMIIYGLSDTKEYQELLVSWDVISQEELDALSLPSCSCASEQMLLLLKYLYRLNNRVKSRVFLYLLRKCKPFVSSDLISWLIMMEDKGIDASIAFQLSNMNTLIKLNVEVVLNRWNGTYGRYLGIPITENSMKRVIDIVTKIDTLPCFIWFLEENRGTISYQDLDEALDLYFANMDTPCYNFKPKAMNESGSTNCIKVKNKHKKKKQKQPKMFYAFSGGMSTRSQEETISIEDDAFLSNPFEHFLVPDFLRHQIEEFETIYEPDFDLNPFFRTVDENADVVRETLYDYFSQILDERGPLEVDDDLLVREYNDFPDETHRLVEEAGGLKSFLLESNRFVMVGDQLGLPIHASLLDEAVCLNPVAREFSPSSNKTCSAIFHSNGGHTSPIPYYQTLLTMSASPIHNDFVHTIPPGYPLFDLHLASLPFIAPVVTFHPNPDIRIVPDRPIDTFTMYSTDACNLDKPDKIQQTAVKTNPKAKNKNPRNHPDNAPKKNNLQSAPPRSKKTAIVAVQVDIEVSEQDVNTDPYQPFESQQGDILRMEKEILVVKEHLEEATEKYDHLRSRDQEEIEGLNKQIQDTIETNKIKKKELNSLNQDLESNVRKCHQEKKENQEKIKAVKSNIKLMTETYERYVKEIMEKKKKYEKYLENFIHICVSNFENERSMIEKRTEDLQGDLEDNRARAIAAEVHVLENKKQCELFKIRSKALKAENNIHLYEIMASSKHVTPEFLKQISSLKSFLSSSQQETENIKTKFEEKIKSVKSGSMLSNVLNVPWGKAQQSSNPPPVSQNKPLAGALPSSGPPSTQPSPLAAAPPAQAAQKSQLKSNKPSSKTAKNAPPAPPAAVKSKVPGLASPWDKGTPNPEKRENLLSPAKQTPFNQIIKELQDIFPHYKSGQLTILINEVRSRVGGSLSGMQLEEVVARVTEHILDHQAKTEGLTNQGAAAGNTIKPAQPGHPPQTKQPWRVATGTSKVKFQKNTNCELSPDELCIICHDELKHNPQHMLDCGHWFHKDCITKWLHTQSTCPTCRNHALLPEDFPVLPGRLRTA